LDGKSPSQFVPIYSRHDDVRDYEVEASWRRAYLDRCLRVAGSMDFMAGLNQYFAEHVSDLLFVIHNKDSRQFNPPGTPRLKSEY
jgi:hypothetical protein